MIEFLFFSLGAAHFIFFPETASFAVWTGVACVTVALAVWRRRDRRLRIVSVFMVGAAFGSGAVSQRVEQQLPERFERVPLRVEVVIDSIPVDRSSSVHFLGRVRTVECPAKDCPDLAGQRIRLSWYHPRQPLHGGQIWAAEVKLRTPRGSVNPGGFDYQAWLLSQSVVATGYASGKFEFRGLERNLAYWRQSVKDNFLASAPGLNYQRFFAALLLGDGSDMSASDWQTLQATGTVHLMTVSGLHIGLIAFWGQWLGGILGRLSGALRPLTQAQTGALTKAFLSILLSIIYAAMAGFSIPTLRALVACVIINLALLVDLRLPARALLASCLVVVVCMEPLAWVSPGFYLSFLAVAILLFTFAGRQQGWFRGTIKSQAVLTVGLLLPLLLLGQPASLISPLANLLAVPLVSLVVIPGLMLALLCSIFPGPLAQWILLLVDQVFAWVWQCLEYLAQLPSVLWWPAFEMPPWMLAIGAISVALMLLPSALRVRTVAMLALTACLLGYQSRRPELRLTVLDVGQGLSVIMETPERIWVYDTGARFSESFDAGQQILVPFLRRIGTRQVSVVVSHNDLDHSGGLASLARALPVDELLVGEPVGINRPEAIPCRAGVNWREGNLDFQVLWPPADSSHEGNNSSCVILLEWRSGDQSARILLTGDIDKSVEYQLLSQVPAPVDVLIAPHHGSKTSSGVLFVKRLQPEVVVFSNGYKNRYNHPHPDVTARYDRAGTTMLSTATSGAIVFDWGTGQAPTVKTARTQRNRPWVVSDP